MRRKWLGAYSVLRRRSGRKREEQQCKTVGRYGRKWMERCKIKPITEEVGLPDGRSANTCSQLFLQTQAQWDDRESPLDSSSGSVTGRFGVGGWREEGQNYILTLRKVRRNRWQNCIVTAAVLLKIRVINKSFTIVYNNVQNNTIVNC